MSGLIEDACAQEKMSAFFKGSTKSKDPPRCSPLRPAPPFHQLSESEQIFWVETPPSVRAGVRLILAICSAYSRAGDSQLHGPIDCVQFSQPLCRKRSVSLSLSPSLSLSLSLYMRDAIELHL